MSTRRITHAVCHPGLVARFSRCAAATPAPRPPNPQEMTPDGLRRSPPSAQSHELRGAKLPDIENYARLTCAKQWIVCWRRQETPRRLPGASGTANTSAFTGPDMTREQRTANRRELVERGPEIRTGVAEMLSTPTPLTEKMTLWHKPLCHPQQKVRSGAADVPAERAGCAATRSATSAPCCEEISKDPAMLV